MSQMDAYQELSDKYYNFLLALNAALTGVEKNPKHYEGMDYTALKLIEIVNNKRVLMDRRISINEGAIKLLNSMASYIHDEGEEGSYCDALKYFKEEWSIE